MYIFSHTTTFFILTTLKKDDDTALLPCYNATISFCDNHMQPSTSMRCFITYEVGKVNENFAVAFCSIYTELRLPLVHNDAYKHQVSRTL